jgi:hypothetical protein
MIYMTRIQNMSFFLLKTNNPSVGHSVWPRRAPRLAPVGHPIRPRRAPRLATRMAPSSPRRAPRPAPVGSKKIK